MTGRLPFMETTAAAMMVKQVLEAPEPPSRVSQIPIPAALENLVLRCLAKDPAARPVALELLAALGETKLAERWSSAAALPWWNANLPAAMKAG